MEIWVTGHMGTRTYGYRDIWVQGHMSNRTYGYMEIWVLGHMGTIVNRTYGYNYLPYLTVCWYCIIGAEFLEDHSHL